MYSLDHTRYSRARHSLSSAFLAALAFVVFPLGVSAQTTITIEPDTPDVGNCYPFGFGNLAGAEGGFTAPWTPFTGWIYQNVPAFELQPGDTLAFDTGRAPSGNNQNDFNIELDIAMAPTTVNGGREPAGAFTQVVSNTQTPANPLGDGTTGNFELVFDVENAFSFPGGGLIIRFSNPSASFQADDTCSGASDGRKIVHGDADDSSGFFVARFTRDTNGAFPWDNEGTESIGAFRVVASGTPSGTNPDLSVTKVADNDLVQPGMPGMDMATFTITVTNDGTADGDVNVTDTLAEGLDDISGMPPVASQGSVSIDDVTNEVTWDVGVLMPGQSATLTLPTVATTGATGCLISAATAELDPGDPGTDSDPANNSDSALVGTPSCADLELDIDVGDSFVLTLGLELFIEFDYIITNNGPGDATDLVLTTSLEYMTEEDPSDSFDNLTLPSGVTCESPPTGADRGNGADVSCDIESLGAGQSILIRRQLRLDGEDFADFVINYLGSINALQDDGDTMNDTDGGTVTVIGGGTSGSGGSCFVATAAYGSYLEPEVVLLRKFRDERLLTNTVGRAFVDWYYDNSPTLADVIAGSEWLRRITRWVLTPVVYAIKHPLPTILLLAGIFAGWGARKMML